MGVRYLRSATVAERATVEAKTGSVAVQSPSGVPVLLPSSAAHEVLEGSWISTDGSSKAFVQFADGSTLHLAPNSRVQLLRLRQRRFRLGPEGRTIRLLAEVQSQAESSLWAGATWGPVDYAIVTQHGTVRLQPETRVRLRLSRASLTVVAMRGVAELRRSDRLLRLHSDQRAVARSDGTLLGPLRALENWLQNADFSEVDSGGGQLSGWAFDRQTPSPEARTVLGQAAHRRLPDGRSVIRFVRHRSGGSPATLLYTQELNELDVSEYRHLGVSASLRILAQSLPGGGTERSEFPVLLNLVYESQSGDDFRWRVGFYAQPPRPDDPRKAELEAYDVQVPFEQWYHFETGNLLDEANPFGFAQRGLPRPVRLRRFEIVASGHDFESELDDVGLWLN